MEAFKRIKIHLMKHSIKEIKEKNQTTVIVTQRGEGGGGGGGGGFSLKFYTKRLCPRDQPLTLCIYLFRQ